MVATGVFLSTMDSSMVNVALPTIMRSFATTLAQTEWVALIYLLTITVTLLIWGRLSERLGKAQMYLLGMLVFSIGSVACYLASSLTMLIFCRFIQACGASMMMSSGPAIVKMVFPVHQLGRALGFVGIATSVGLMSGPVISGFLIQFYSWRVLFLVTVPVSVICFGVGWFWLLPTIPPPAAGSLKKTAFDWAGLFVWTLLIVLTVLTSTHHGAFSGKTVLAGLFGFCLLLFFFKVIEHRAEAPLLPLLLFRDRHYAIAMSCAMLSFVVLFVVLLLIPFYLDYVLRLPVDRIGLVMMSVPLAVFVVSPLSGWLYDKMGARLLTTTGLAICCLALICLCFLDEQSTVLDVAWRMVLLGAGQALFLSPNTASVLATVDPHHIGITSGVLATARNVGMLAGVTLAGLVFGEVFSLLSGGLDLKDFGSVHTTAFIRSLQISFGLTALVAMSGALLSGRR
ncbi:MAG: MFS transporter [Proteobacteria bacterium]|nr:MFS transporter [Pseudomonadota bacterium]MBU1649539.1 MFS transporter [Pseudomonadota bacterium]